MARLTRVHTGRHCARCDNEVPLDAEFCPWLNQGKRGGVGAKRLLGSACGCRAFYVGRRPVRHIMGAPLPDAIGFRGEEG